jgi:hypothetical protein
MKAKRASATCDQRTRIMGLFLASLYTMAAKAAMLLAVLGHFRLRRGLERLRLGLAERDHFNHGQTLKGELWINGTD